MSGKKYSDASERLDRQKFYDPNEALGLVRELASANFDEAVDIAVGLGVDPRKADQMMRGTVALPSGTGGEVRVVVRAAVLVVQVHPIRRVRGCWRGHQRSSRHQMLPGLAGRY